MRTLKDKVIYVLEKYSHTRNSDLDLMNYIWYEFHEDILFKDTQENWSIRLKDIKKLPREDHIKRWRARIQNEEKRYLPTDINIIKKRGNLENDWRCDLNFADNPAKG